MEVDADNLLLAFNRLSAVQKDAAIDRLNEYLQGDYIVKDRLVKESERRNSIKKMDVGPTVGGTCPYCGR